MPGTKDPVANEDEAIAVAKEIGTPLLIKAVSGGGGRGMTVVRVPAYSPYAVAEFTVALMMMLNRRPHLAQHKDKKLLFATLSMPVRRLCVNMYMNTICCTASNW